MGDLGTILASSDGAAWAHSPFETIDMLVSVAWNGAEFVISSSGFMTSSVLRGDGMNWKSDYLGLVVPMQRLFWTSSGFLGVGAYGNVFSSPDGQVWANSLAPTGSDLLGLASDGKTVVAVGAKGTILTTTDRAAWTHRTIGNRNPLSKVAWDGKQYVAVGGFGAVLTSPDAAMWTSQPPLSTAGSSASPRTGSDGSRSASRTPSSRARTESPGRGGRR